ncbi:CBL-interacting serine/threonine-protein kinase 19 [Tritrichomonas foetus]|uniref:CBL-interacting serine/threonine-protein kinase 19 n=1 Tax=Tritrichomonas foetus TaxID=1144522 RepID=A0A1J4KZ13_9EUKA|nr:CBL-interacting serine/threonine-protein kinase 19 [Tritrichomonas foetus]|eukprot:OHT16394.1 CBL-interacting serine/threonine-protein kinase 19 [Tritrichomonas foetus]
MEQPTLTEETEYGTKLEIPRAFGKYEYVSTIGRGGSSVVITVIHKRTNIVYAAKVASRQSIVENGQLEYLERELRVARKMNHPNIIKVFDEIYLENVIIIIMEYCENGDLLTFVTLNPFLVVALAKKMFFQLCEAVSYIHKNRVAHRDLKPENIFIDNEMNIKIGDFGLSREYMKKEELFTTLCGTFYYLSPEIILQKGYDGRKSDVWSLGIILYVLFLGTLPWKSTNQNDLLDEICTGVIEIPDQVSSDVKEVIIKCCSLDPDRRPTVDQLFDMPLLITEKYAFLNQPKTYSGRGSIPSIGSAFSQRMNATNKSRFSINQSSTNNSFYGINLSNLLNDSNGGNSTVNGMQRRLKAYGIRGNGSYKNVWRTKVSHSIHFNQPSHLSSVSNSSAGSQAPPIITSPQNPNQYITKPIKVTNSERRRSGNFLNLQRKVFV